MFWKSLDKMVKFSIKPDYQMDENESPNLVNKTGPAKKGEYQGFLCSISIKFFLKN